MPRSKTRVFLVASIALVVASAIDAAAEPRADAPAGLSGSEWSQIQGAIEARSYEVEPLARDGASPTRVAVNSRQHYRTTFRREGIELAAGPREDWRVSLALAGYGYEGDVRPLQDAEPVAVGDRVEYHRGPLTEWYVNRPGGLEQGFTIPEPETRQSGPIVLAMAIGAGLEARVESPSLATFRDKAGHPRLRYAGVAALDADGRPLVSRLEAEGGQLRILVAAENARFPITVDPTFVQEAKLVGANEPGGQADAWFGSSAAVSGDTLVVAAPDEDSTPGTRGVAYVFTRSGTNWTEQARLEPPDPTGYDLYAYSVAIDGDTIAVGAPGQSPVQDLAGATYVFVRNGSGSWGLQQELSGTTPGANLGASVSLAGDTLVVGAPFGQGPGPGTAHVYVRSGDVWSEEQVLQASDGTIGDEFGLVVSLSEDTAVIGAPLALGGTSRFPPPGAAYVFTRSGAAWTQQAELAPSNPRSSGFGQSVAVDGETALVSGHAAAGASADVFVRSGSAWTFQQTLSPPDPSYVPSVALAGDTAVIGAEVLGGDTAYVFVRSGTAWSQQQQLAPAIELPSANAGPVAVAISGDTVILGVPYDDVGTFRSGSGFVFTRTTTTWSQQAQLASHGASFDRVGYSVALEGDTLLVGTPYDDTLGGGDAGSVYVFVRSGIAWLEQARLEPIYQHPGQDPAEARGAAFGWSVALSGDTALIGAPYDGITGNGDAPPGAAYVFVRTGTSWSQQAKLVGPPVPPNGSTPAFGQAVSVSSDTAAIGRQSVANPGPGDGSVSVYVRSGGQWLEQQVLQGQVPGSNFGAAIALAEDTLAVTSYDTAHVFLRSGAVWSPQQDLPLNQGFLTSVALSGDSLVVGRPGGPGNDGVMGVALVFVRSGTTWTQQQALTASDASPNDQFGEAVGISGDALIVGAPRRHYVSLGVGSAYVFTRTGAVWTEQQELAASDGTSRNGFGFAVAISAGSVAVAAPFAEVANSLEAGSAYVFRGVTTTDAGVTKTDGQTSAVPGAPVTYQLTVTDAGPDPGLGLHVVDATPPALTNVSWTCSASPGSSCPASGTGGIDHSANVAAGGALSYTVTGIIAPSATGTLVNTATVTPPAGVSDPNSGNDSATDVDTLTREADLTMSLVDAPDPVVSGKPLSYAMQVTNLGPSDSSGMTAAATLPPQVAFVDSNPGGPACTEAAGTVTCTLAGLPAGGSQVVTLQTQVNTGVVGPIHSSAAVAGVDTDPASSNGSATQTTEVIPPGRNELRHAATLFANLESVGGVADEDLYRIRQNPYSSYEVVVDGTSADIGAGQGPHLERVGSDATSVLQDSVPAGAGGSRSLRFENDQAASLLDQYIRVRSAGCTTTCTAADVYRIRAWDTTLAGPRFNDSATQLTLLIVQNTTDIAVTAHVHFWDANGAPLGSAAVPLLPRSSAALNTATVPGVAGQSGSLTLSHDGGYGALVGKAVSIEPATGFSFDTPLVPRPR